METFILLGKKATIGFGMATDTAGTDYYCLGFIGIGINNMFKTYGLSFGIPYLFIFGIII